MSSSTEAVICSQGQRFPLTFFTEPPHSPAPPAPIDGNSLWNVLTQIMKIEICWKNTLLRLRSVLLRFMDTGRIKTEVHSQRLRTVFDSWECEFVCTDVKVCVFIHTCLLRSVYRCMHLCMLAREGLRPWIWSAVAGSVFTRPEKQRRCVVRDRRTYRPGPKHSWHQGTARPTWEPP